MRLPRLLPFVFAAALPLVSFAQAPKMNADEKAVWDLEHRWLQAYREGDAAALKQCESPHYADMLGDGHILTREEDIAGVENGTFRVSEDAMHEVAVALHDHTAVVTGRLVLKGSAGREPIDGIYAFTDCLVKTDAGWQGAATFTTRLSPSTHFATTPLWRDGGGWSKRHADFVAEAKRESDVDLLFVGDSITDFWRSRGLAQWKQYWGKYHAANIGLSGDRTEHVLWRLQNGEIDGMHPKAIVLMIGTNNTGIERDGQTPRDTVEDTADGVKAVVAELRRRCPEAKVLLLAIFPRSPSPDSAARKEVEAINERIQGLDDGRHVFYRDIGKAFLESDGTLSPNVMPDYLHPNAHGYDLWGAAIEAEVARLMR